MALLKINELNESEDMTKVEVETYGETAIDLPGMRGNKKAPVKGLC